MKSIRDRILNAEDIPRQTIDVPEWGVKVEVRGMTVGEQQTFLRRVTKRLPGGDSEIDRDKFTPELLIATCFDPDTGERVFETADRDMLSTKRADVVNRIMRVSADLSGLSQEAEEATAEDFDSPQEPDSY